MLELHYWLQNFTKMPNSPKCDEPRRLAGEEIKSLQPNEFACKPEVSPTSMFLEVVVGKNMSLICNVEVIMNSYNILYLYIQLLYILVELIVSQHFCKLELFLVSCDILLGFICKDKTLDKTAIETKTLLHKFVNVCMAYTYMRGIKWYNIWSPKNGPSYQMFVIVTENIVFHVWQFQLSRPLSLVFKTAEI